MAARNWHGAQPLHCAAEAGQERVMRYLIGQGAGKNALDSEKQTPLHIAAAAGHLGAVKLLRSVKAAVTSDMEGFTPLMRAVAGGHPKCLSELLKDALQVDKRNAKEQTPLHLAAAEGRQEVMQLLLDAGAELNVEDSTKSTPLLLAVRADRVECARMLLERGAKWSMPDDFGFTPLALSALNGSIPLVQALLDAGAEINVCNVEGRTPLHLAVEGNHLEIVELLVARGADCLSGTRRGRTPLHMAAAHGNLAMMTYLLQHGAEPSVKDLNGLRPLHDAAACANGEALDCLLEAGALVNDKDNNGLTALHTAAERGNANAVKILLDKRADIGSSDNAGRKPLHMAARYGDAECLQTLLAAEAEADSVDNTGRSPLHIAAAYGNARAVEILLEARADVNLPDSRGCTALHDAAWAGNAAIPKLLLQAGADATLKDSCGRTPLYIAAIAGNLEAIRCLLEAAAALNTTLYLDNNLNPLQAAIRHGHAQAVKLLGGSDDDVELANRLERKSSGSESETGLGNPVEDQWAEQFARMQRFIEKHHRVPAPGEVFEGHPLGRWVELQIEKIRWDLMTEKQMGKLASIRDKLKGWRSSLRFSTWVGILEQFLALHRRFPFPWEKWDGVGAWIPETPPTDDSTAAPKGKVEKGIVWMRQMSQPDPEQSPVDDEQYDLGWWCKFQQCMQSVLKQSGQAAALEQIAGWKWEDEDDRRKAYRHRRRLVALFIGRYARMPEEDDMYVGVPIGQWCKVLQQMQANGELPAEYNESLLRIRGWKWTVDVKAESQRWEDKVAKLTAQMEIGKEDRKFWDLASRKWRKLYEKGSLSQEHVQALESLPRGPMRYAWEQWLSVLADFVTENRRMPKSREWYKGMNLGTWCSERHRAWREGKLALARVVELVKVAHWPSVLAASKGEGAKAPEPTCLLMKLARMDEWMGRGGDPWFEDDPDLARWMQRVRLDAEANGIIPRTTGHATFKAAHERQIKEEEAAVRDVKEDGGMKGAQEGGGSQPATAAALARSAAEESGSKLPADIRALLKKAQGGKVLKSREIVMLLDGWKASGMPVQERPPDQPPGEL